MDHMDHELFSMIWFVKEKFGTKCNEIQLNNDDGEICIINIKKNTVLYTNDLDLWVVTFIFGSGAQR